MLKIATQETPVNIEPSCSGQIAPQLMSWVLIGGLLGLLFAHPLIYARTTAFGLLCSIIGLCWLAILIGQRRTPGQFALSPTAAWPVAVIFSSAVLSLSFNIDAGWSSLWSLIAHFLLLWVAWWLTRTMPILKRLGIALAFSAGSAGLYAWLQYLDLDPLPPGASIGQYRIISLFDNPNHLGNFLACALPLLLADFLRSSSANTCKERIRTRYWITLYLLLALVYGGLLLSASRGAWLAGLTGCLVAGIGLLRQWIAKQAGPRPLPLIGLVLLLTSITLLLAQGHLIDEPHQQASLAARALSSRHLYTLLDPAARTASGDTFLVYDEAINHRYFIWQVTWEMINTHPFRGLGYGSYPKRFIQFRNTSKHYPRYQTLNWTAKSQATLYAHNEYLHLWAENGILGLLGFLSLVTLGMAQFLRRLWRTTTPDAAYLWGLLGMVIVMLVHSLVSYPLHLPLNGAVFWVLLGILFGWKGPRSPS